MKIEDIVSKEEYERVFSNGRNKVLKAVLEHDDYIKEFPISWNMLRTTLDHTDLYESLQSSINTYNINGNIHLCGFYLNSNEYSLDKPEGLCEDFDPSCVRYVKDGKVYKMKTSKFFHKVAQNLPLPEVAIHWLAEVVQDKRKASIIQYSDDSIVLKYGNTPEDFYKIYTEGPDYSCMNDGKHISFYLNNCNATAAWIENKEGKLLARCVIFNKVYDTEGNIYRLAERQYSDKEFLKEVLIRKLIYAGLIDGFKKVGAGAHDEKAFYTNNNTLINSALYINCELGDNDIISYQDSFKYYYPMLKRAYNTPIEEVHLNVTYINIYIPEVNSAFYSYFLYLPNYHKRIEITGINNNTYSYRNVSYCGYYEIIDGIQVPKEMIISQYDLKGNFISDYPDCYTAAEKLGIKAQGIIKCLNGFCKTSHKYIWKRKYDSLT